MNIDVHLAGYICTVLAVISGCGVWARDRHSENKGTVMAFISEVTGSVVVGAVVFFGGIHYGLKPVLIIVLVLVAANNSADILSKMKTYLDVLDLSKVLEFLRKGSGK